MKYLSIPRLRAYLGATWALLVTVKDLSSFWVIPDDERNDASVTSFISTLSVGESEPVVLAFAPEKQKRVAFVSLWII